MASRRTPDSSSSSSRPPKSPSGAKARKSVAKPAPLTVPPEVSTEVSASPPMEPPPPAKARSVRRSASPTPKARTAPAARPVVTPDVRRGMIAEAAYLRAEKRGFAPGHEEEDWLAAEIEVDRLLGADSGPAQ
jgi:hypothetical protein